MTTKDSKTQNGEKKVVLVKSGGQCSRMKLIIIPHQAQKLTHNGLKTWMLGKPETTKCIKEYIKVLHDTSTRVFLTWLQW